MRPEPAVSVPSAKETMPRAVATGRPDLCSVFAGTALSQPVQAVEIIALTMGVYLLLSLLTSAVMSFYGWRLNRSLAA